MKGQVKTHCPLVRGLSGSRLGRTLRRSGNTRSHYLRVCGLNRRACCCSDHNPVMLRPGFELPSDGGSRTLGQASIRDSGAYEILGTLRLRCAWGAPNQSKGLLMATAFNETTSRLLVLLRLPARRLMPRHGTYLRSSRSPALSPICYGRSCEWPSKAQRRPRASPDNGV